VGKARIRRKGPDELCRRRKPSGPGDQGGWRCCREPVRRACLCWLLARAPTGLLRQERDGETEWRAVRPGARIADLQRKRERVLLARREDRRRDWTGPGLVARFGRDPVHGTETSLKDSPWLLESLSARLEHSGSRKHGERNADRWPWWREPEQQRPQER